MNIDIMTLFPEMCEAVLSESIIGRARSAGLVRIACHNIRDYTLNKHNRVDDSPYGGGTGMIMQAQPIFDCYAAIRAEASSGGVAAPSGGEQPLAAPAVPSPAAETGKIHLIYMSPQGKTLTQERVRELSEYDHIAILCGHYEGVDERVLDAIVDEQISIGDYVVTGGELPACILADSICRMLPGVLANEDAFTKESHYGHLLEYPQYTRPAVWQGRSVPAVLLSGDHAKVDRWKLEQAVERTLKQRPDMLENAGLTPEERSVLDSLKGTKSSGEQ